MKKIFGLTFFLVLLLTIIQPVSAITGTKKVYLNPTNDSEVNMDEPDTNYGRRAFISTQALYGDIGIFSSTFLPRINALSKFNVSSIPQDSYIEKAYLKLFAYHVNPEAPCTLRIYRLTNDWDERRVTFNNQPRSTMMNEYQYTVYGKGFLRSSGDEAWDITGLVRKWVSGEYPNYGLMIVNNSDEEDSLCKFYSKDETVEANQGKKIQLIVEYVPPVTFTSVTAPENQITSTTATISWTADGLLIASVYYRKDQPGSQWAGRPNTDTLSSNRVILEDLAPSTRYAFYVNGKDDANRSVNSELNFFTTKNISGQAVDPNTMRLLNPLSGLAARIIGLVGETGNQALGSGQTEPGDQSQADEVEPDTTEQNRNNDIQIVNLRYEMSSIGGTFWWTTKEEDGSSMMADIKTSGFVYVGFDENVSINNYETNFGKNQAEVNHTVQLKYLEPATTYHYLVYSKSDDNRNGAIKGIFTTMPQSGGESNANNEQSGDDASSGSTNTNTNSNGTNNNSYNNQDNRTNTINWPFIILIILVIILVILIMTKKKKIQTKNQEESVHTRSSPVQAYKKTGKKDQSAPSSKKKKGCFIALMIVVGFFVLSSVVPFLGMMISPGIFPMIVESILDKAGGFQIGSFNNSSSQYVKEAETSSSFAKIEVPSQTNLSFSAIPQSGWPEGTVGGLYKVEPSGAFSKMGNVTIDLKDSDQKGFALGYWHPDTQKWEYIPTIKIFGSTYKALIAHASEVGGYAFGLSGALEYDPHFKNADEQAAWESLKSDLEGIARDEEAGFDTTVKKRLAESKLDRIASMILDRCAGMKSFDNQMDYFFIWHIAQLLNATAVDEKLGTNMNRCIDMQSTRGDSKYEYMIRERQELDNDLNVAEVMQMVWKGVVTHEGYPIVSGYDNRDWRTDWQVYARTEYHADVDYGAFWDTMDLPTPEGTANNGIVTHVLLFSLKNVQEGQKFKIRGVSVGDAPGYYRNWHEDFKWHINHPSTSDPFIPSDPNKNVFEMDGTLVQDNDKEGAVIKYGGLSKDQQAQMDEAAAIVKNSGIAGFEGIPAYYQELAPEMTLNIVKGIPYNE